VTHRIHRLELQFSTARRTQWAPLVLAAGVLATALVGWIVVTARLEHDRQAQVISQSEDRMGMTEEAAPPSAADPRATKAAAGVARELQVPWAQMLASLEAVPSRDVALLGVEPSTARHNMRITAEARTVDAMLDFLEAMRSDSFPEVLLTSHQVQAQTPGTPIRFVLQARWSAR
jgi:hypothetical protein